MGGGVISTQGWALVIIQGENEKVRCHWHGDLSMVWFANKRSYTHTCFMDCKVLTCDSQSKFRIKLFSNVYFPKKKKPGFSNFGD